MRPGHNAPGSPGFHPRMRMAFLGLLLAGCAENELTGRRQLMLVDEKTEARLGIESYQQVLAEERISRDPKEVDPLRRVGQRIAQAAAHPEFAWEFNVIVDDRTANAWCLPGGKIGFYTGIFPVLQDEAGMAFVMGHEVAHALLHHGAERMSQTMAAGAAGSLLNAVVGRRNPEHQEGVMAAFGAAVGVGVLLPYSRAHESEADRIGLDLMARAGYDPRVSVDVWKRMARTGGAQPPVFLSTHPSHATRIEDLEKRMPGAVALFEAASSRAPVARLPAIADRPGAARGNAPKEAVAASTRPRVQVEEPHRITDDGRPAAQVDFRFDRDVYLESIDIDGPGSARARRTARAGVAAGTRRQIVLTPDEESTGELPSGSYAFTFRGSVSGALFELRAAVVLR